MGESRATTSSGVPTFRVDFNAPRFRAWGPVAVGDVVRLVDLDPTAGWSYARVTTVREVGADLSICGYERAGEFHHWPESYVIVEPGNRSNQEQGS